MGARPSQQKEAHIQHLCAPSKEHHIMDINAYKAFQKLHFRSIKWYKKTVKSQADIVL